MRDDRPQGKPSTTPPVYTVTEMTNMFLLSASGWRGRNALSHALIESDTFWDYYFKPGIYPVIMYTYIHILLYVVTHVLCGVVLIHAFFTIMLVRVTDRATCSIGSFVKI